MKITRSQLQRLITETLEEMNYLGTDDFMAAEEGLASAMDAQDASSNPQAAEALINNLLNMIETLDPGGPTANNATRMVEEWEEENKTGGFTGYGVNSDSAGNKQ